MVEIDAERLQRWLDARDLGTGPVSMEPIGGGTQNIMARVKREGLDVVLRHPPAHKRANSDATMQREAVLLRALTGSPVPHPRLIADEPNLDALGASFYVMEPVDGFAPTLGLPDAYGDPAWKHSMGLSMVDGIAALGCVDYRSVGLVGFGKPDGWLERQVERWRIHLGSYVDTPNYPGHQIPEVEHVGAWLSANQPTEWTPGIIHGDYHFGNVMFRHDEPRLAAIVDWELATIGDPLLDLGALLTTFPTGQSGVSAIDPTGLPKRDELIDRYVVMSAPSGRVITPSLVTWYQVLAAYRLGIILEGTNARAYAGQAPREIGDQLHAITLALFTQAANLIES
jgi:aminoglycoside phosphotransferase (APT) family kinase protein